MEYYMPTPEPADMAMEVEDVTTTSMASAPAVKQAWTQQDTDMSGAGSPPPVVESMSTASTGGKRATKIDLTGLPLQTRQLLATLGDEARPECEPFGLEYDVDVEVGCSTNDIIRKMRETEKMSKRSGADAKHLAYRRVLVDWMCEIGEAFSVQKCTMHVAVGYLDRILQDVAVTKARLQLVAMCCLLIAAKYEEAEENVPSVALLTEYTNNAYLPNMIHQMEIMVLTRLQWSLTVVTPLHYLGLYVAKGMIFNTDTMQGVALIPKVPRYVKKYVEFFADLTLQEHAFQQYQPSLLAAAIVAAARRALSIRPLWCAALTELVGYSQVELSEVFSHVWKYYLECFPAEGAAADKAHAPYATPTNVTALVDDLDE